LLLNWKKSIKHANSSIINKFRNNYINGGNTTELSLKENKNCSNIIIKYIKKVLKQKKET